MSKECDSCLYHNSNFCRNCGGVCPFTESNFEKILNETPYLWIITKTYPQKENITEIEPTDVYISSIMIELPSYFIKERGTKFSLFMDDDLRYEGYIMGEFEGHEPLWDFGYKHDCNEIKLLKEEK
jgi:hypothetical protein